MPGMLLHHEKRLDVFMSGTFFAIACQHAIDSITGHSARYRPGIALPHLWQARPERSITWFDSGISL